MRDVNNGWLIRYLHSNAASAFFFLVYLHIGRGLYYRSYNGLRTIGTVIFILMTPAGCPLTLPLLVLIEFISYLASNVSFILKLITDISLRGYNIVIEIYKCKLSRTYLGLLFVILLSQDLQHIFWFSAFTAGLLILVYILFVDITFSNTLYYLKF